MNSVVNLKDVLDGSIYGGKAVNLASLIQAGLPVPGGFAVGLSSFNDNSMLTDIAKQQIKAFLDPSKMYAVRSSALAEDAEGASWAGQFESYLDTTSEDVIAKIELCHNSAKNRAKAYAEDKDVGEFNIAVVVQEMLNPEYAGVLFTEDPLTGEDRLVVEYVEGLGEELVSGRADPVRVILGENEEVTTPFDISQLSDLAIKVKELFGKPQDIEWVSQDNKIWLVQARPITTTHELMEGFYLGEPSGLFYWGPSRAVPMYMNDFIAGVERLFKKMAKDPSLPTPPKTLVLFYRGKMVWLNNAKEFTNFTEKTFQVYVKLNRLDEDIQSWNEAKAELPKLKDQLFTDKLIDSWFATELAEFSLYGAEVFIAKQLQRFDDRTLPKIWGAFTLPDKPSFLNTLDEELANSKDPVFMANKYPWIRHGYAGPNDEAVWYFKKRLEAIEKDGLLKLEDNRLKRQTFVKEFGLTEQEVAMLTLARRLAEFMDDRKKWMMETRHLIIKTIGNIEHGWHFSDGKASLLNKEVTRDLWKRYIDFKSSSSAVVGNVANTGGRHFVCGEVAVLNSHTDPVENDKILVVPSTSPGWVPLMRHARALVTDHGGMMSHAAIVAREFNLPCIVSTKQGTKVLKDGDKVVLDLVKGEVIR